MFCFFKTVCLFVFLQIFPMILTKYHNKRRKRKILPKLYAGMGSLLGSWQTYVLPIAKFGYICLIEVTTWRPCYITKLRKTNEQTNKQTMNGFRGSPDPNKFPSFLYLELASSLSFLLTWMLRWDIALHLRRLEMGIDSNQLLIDPHFGEHDEDWQLHNCTAKTGPPAEFPWLQSQVPERTTHSMISMLNQSKYSSSSPLSPPTRTVATLTVCDFDDYSHHLIPHFKWKSYFPKPFCNVDPCLSQLCVVKNLVPWYLGSFPH